MLCQHLHEKIIKCYQLIGHNFIIVEKAYNIYVTIAIFYRILIKTRSNMKTMQEIISIKIIQISCKHHA